MAYIEWKKALKKLTSLIVYLTIGVLIVRPCFLDIFKVPSDSMRNTLKSGDLIIINKTLYSGLLHRFFSSFLKSRPKGNDILVFSLRRSDSIFYVKRCVGLPGQLIEMRDGNVFIDKQCIKCSFCVRRYRIWYSNYGLAETSIAASKVDLMSSEFQRYPKYVSIYLEDAQAEMLVGNPGIDSVTVYGNIDWHDGSRSNGLQGPIQTVAPMKIPFAGMRIKFDSANYALYRDVFKKDGSDVTMRGNSYFTDGVQQQYYIFKDDYYFMLGDNRDHSEDSRYFGLVPKHCIEGAVVLKF